MFTYSVYETRYLVNADGTADVITGLLWQAHKTVGGLTVTKDDGYTDIPSGYPAAQVDYYTLTEAECSTWLVDLNDAVAIEAELDAMIEAAGEPQIGSGTPWTEAGQLIPWVVNTAVAVGDIRVFEGQSYRCLQAHTTQIDWTPPLVPALWVIVPKDGVIPLWKQPTGAQDAYEIDAIVYWDNPNDSSNLWIYKSLIPANTTEPGRDGTFDRWWNPEQNYTP